jgi:hypothetical protein
VLRVIGKRLVSEDYFAQQFLFVGSWRLYIGQTVTGGKLAELVDFARIFLAGVRVSGQRASIFLRGLGVGGYQRGKVASRKRLRLTRLIF